MIHNGHYNGVHNAQVAPLIGGTGVPSHYGHHIPLASLRHYDVYYVQVE